MIRNVSVLKDPKREEATAYPRATIPSPPTGRLAWNCFSLLTGGASPTATGAADAMRNRQDNRVKTKTSHLGYMVKAATSK
jgi:hypothetical protein